MSHRQQQKAEARERRLAAERERADATRRRRIQVLIGTAVAVLAAVVAIVVLAGGGGDEKPATSSEPAAGAETRKLLAGIPQDGSALGSPDAPVVLTEFADLQCPFCADFATQVLPDLIREYVRPGKVRVELRLLRFVGPDSDRGARAAHAAATRDRMWNFVDAFFRNQGEEGTGYADDEFISQLAREAGLGPSTLLQAIEAGRHEEAIARDEGEASDAGLDSTPSFLIRSKDGEDEVLPVQQLSVDAFREAIDARLG